ncbi:MAG: calcium/sodium antiporter [Opitutae bacterium]|jgi:cation:H+ antiporter|nr:calcium/sodium antiporter [Opitutae bacterium]
MDQILHNLTLQAGLGTGFAYCVVLAMAIVVGLFLLTKGGDALSDHSSLLAKALGVPSVVVGLTIVSIATSAPELFTSIAAIRSNAQGLILGNIIGSNIANIGLILGLALMVKNVDTRNTISKSQITTLLLLTLVFCCFLFFNPSQNLSLLPGVLLLGFISVYLFGTTAKALGQRKKERETKTDKESLDTPPAKAFLLSASFILLSTAALWAGSDFLVFGAKNLAIIAGVPEELIGFSILAIGTSLPELAASISLVKKGEHKMLLGNIVGSNLFNIGLVGGVAGILGPVSSKTPSPWIDYVSLLLLTALFCLWLKGRTLTRKEGFVLLAGYLASSLFTWILNGSA